MELAWTWRDKGVRSNVGEEEGEVVGEMLFLAKSPPMPGSMLSNGAGAFRKLRRGGVLVDIADPSRHLGRASTKGVYFFVKGLAEDAR